MNMNLQPALRAWRYGAALTVAGLAFCQIAQAATKTVTFGWEDGTSTSTFHVVNPTGNDLPPLAITPDSASISTANVSVGAMTDYGPSGNPFLTPLIVPVTPNSGIHMLEVSLTPMTIDTGTDGVVYMGVLTGLDPGDTYSMEFHAFDPTDGRSPSIPPNSTLAKTGALTTADGFGVPLQTFLTGSGWLDTNLDADGNAITHLDPTITYNPSASTSDAGDYNKNLTVDAADYTVWRDTLGSTTDLRANGDNTLTSANKIDQADYTFWNSKFGNTAADAVRLEADLFYQSLTQGNGGVEKLYIDDLTITVTSNNPNATIYLPDGTSVLVNPAVGAGRGGSAAVPEPTTAVLLLVGIVGFCLGRRRSPG